MAKDTTQEQPRGQRMMHIRLAPPPGSREDALFVGINGKNYLVKYDEDVYVPETVYDVICESLKAQRNQDRKIRMLSATA